MKYKVEITETLQMNVEVEADSLEEAERIVIDKWYKGDYILDADNFVDVDFEAEELKPEKIKVVLLEPNKLARTVEIGNLLMDYEKIIGGNAEAIYPFEEDVCIVRCDPELTNGMSLNRSLFDKDNNLIILSGTFFLCNCEGDFFKSLSAEQLKKYKSEFKLPERFIKVNGELKGVKYNPNKDRER